MARLGAKESRSKVLSILKNTFLFEIFWWKRPHTSFLGLIGYMVRSGQNCSGRKLCSILPQKPPRICFSKMHVFGLNFCTKSHLTYFMGQTDLDGAIEDKSFLEQSFVHPKKHVFVRNFLTKPAPYYFSGPNWLYGAFGGKIVPDENIAQFCLKSPLEFVFPKNTFSVWIFELKRTSPIFLAKWTRCYDWGQKCPGVKLRPS